VVESNKEPLTLLAGRGKHYKGKKPLLATACEICGFKNHLTADCYRLVGYPSRLKEQEKTCIIRSLSNWNTRSLSNWNGQFQIHTTRFLSDWYG